MRGSVPATKARLAAGRIAQRNDAFPFCGFISNLAAETPTESSSFRLERFSPCSKLGHIENVLLFRATGPSCQEARSVGRGL